MGDLMSDGGSRFWRECGHKLGELCDLTMSVYVGRWFFCLFPVEHGFSALTLLIFGAA